MKTTDLLPFCRYYKGEEAPPRHIEASFWHYEQKWVEFMLNGSPLLSQMIADYISAGLVDFEKFDNVPLS